jgi:hypothetical protein
MFAAQSLKSQFMTTGLDEQSRDTIARIIIKLDAAAQNRCVGTEESGHHSTWVLSAVDRNVSAGSGRGWRDVTEWQRIAEAFPQRITSL